MLWSVVASVLIAGVVSTVIPKVPEVPHQAVYNVILSLLTFSFLFFLCFFLLTRRTVAYLLSLADGLEVIAGGDLRYRIPAPRADELGKIAENINSMAEKLERQIEKERRSEQAKMELITGISHDLRTPLTSIVGYLELLRNKAYRDDSEYERFVGNTYNRALQLKALIDDLFEYTRLTTREARLLKQRVDLRELLHQIESEFHPLAKESGISVVTALPPAPLFMELDPEKIRRAVDNLFMNALKFSVKPGVIRLSLETAAVGSKRQAAIRVENDGEPIGPEQEERLFERFYKTDDSRAKGSVFGGGSGLGLSIARSIARLHGGDVRLIHSDGHYDFRIELPLEAR
ncbi:HAMP domain-containing histidine kinase [Cohnella sp. CBP 2801]|uniref:histidine kinase n=2 Tax=Cohnella zeiphila TaxID=2761120 RepID=A0A7X0SIH0_9BACL|nr:HAMP domain-containing histidine kinase [Cohnella zeiphila]